MRLGMHLTEPLDGHLGVDLRGVELRVTQHLLDRPQVRTTLEHLRGHGVPEEVTGALAMPYARVVRTERLPKGSTQVFERSKRRFTTY